MGSSHDGFLDPNVRIGVFDGGRLGIVDEDAVVDVSDLVPESPGVDGPLQWFIASEWDRRFDHRSLRPGRRVLPLAEVVWDRPFRSRTAFDPLVELRRLGRGDAPRREGGREAVGVVLSAEAHHLEARHVFDHVFGFVRLTRGEGASAFVSASSTVVTVDEALSAGAHDERAVFTLRPALAAVAQASYLRRLVPGDVVAGPPLSAEIQYTV